MRSARRPSPNIFRLRVTLNDVEPPVWRRLRISSGATLTRAVRVIAVAVGWPPGRSWVVTRQSLRYEGRGPAPRGRRDRPSGEVRLRQLLHDPGAELELEYGTGHAWHLVLRLEGILPPNDQQPTPWCEDGEGTAPPIDVGGPWGYEAWRSEGVDGPDDLGLMEGPMLAKDPRSRVEHPGRASSSGHASGPVPRFNPAHVNALLERLRSP